MDKNKVICSNCQHGLFSYLNVNEKELAKAIIEGKETLQMNCQYCGKSYTLKIADLIDKEE